MTGVTDMSPRNDAANAAHVSRQVAACALLQGCVLAGELSLGEITPDRWTLGPAKLHLHEAAFPDFDETAAFVAAAHEQKRGVAIYLRVRNRAGFRPGLAGARRRAAR
ncbi:MAG: hypothetical protein QM676_01620 [Novosphingobium sp.]